MGRSLLDLPVEVLLTIISCLSEKDIVQLLQTCRYLNDISRSGGIWRSLAIHHYGPHLFSLSNKHAEWFYKNILTTYGCLLGTWVRDDYPFGGLLDVKFQDNTIVGSTWRPHPDLGRPLKKTGLFVIKYSSEEGVVIQCDIDNKHNHQGSIEFQNKEKSLLKFQTVCQSPLDHRTVIRSNFTWIKKAE